MTALELLAHLDGLGVQLHVDGDRLRVNAARGQLTDELKGLIAAHKPELLALVAARARPGAIPALPRGGPLPLSFFQERLWVLQRLEPESTDNNIVATLPVSAPAERVVEAIRGLVQRHEILRTAFPGEGGVPSLSILPPERVPIELRDLAGRPDEEQRREVRAEMEAAAHVPFDLATQPPARFAVHRLADDRSVMACTAHHIALDAWSLRLLERELLLAIAGAAVPEPALQYADFAAWQRGRQNVATTDAELGWWTQHLAGIPPVSTLPPDRPRALHGTGAVRTFALAPELVAGIRSLVREEGATVYMLLLAACAAVLRWHSGQDDLVLGSPMGVRERPELETVIGPFVNVLALRLDLGGEPTCAELLARARAAVLDAHAHRDAPFEKLVERLNPVRSPDHAPVFQVAVVMHNVPGESNMAIVGGGANFDLTWFVRESKNELLCGLEYREDLYDAATIDRFAGRLAAFLTAAVADRHRRVSRISLLSAEERETVLERFNATSRATDRAIVSEQIARQIARTPAAVAVAFEGAVLTYAELGRRAADLARGLRAMGIGPGTTVGLCLPRSLDMVVALLAILEAGGAYLPLDPDFPAERLGFMLADSGARVLVGSPPRGLAVPDGVVVVDVATARDAPEGTATPAGPSDLAYVIYTSGSTGRPKGVRVSHAALANFLASMRDEPGLAPGDVLAAVTTLSFDIAGLELFLPLTVGARIELVGKATAQSGSALAERLASSGAAVMQATPSTWRQLVEAGWRGRPGFRALCGGEALPRDLADALLERTGELWNLYGPTETTIWSTAQRVEPGAGPVLIGRPIANTRVYILDRGDQPLPPGIAGEIWIGGAGVAEGYHGRPELTAERFLPDPFAAGGRMYRTGDLGRWHADGRLEHLGRLDHQVKVRGFRIELGEIETVLGAHPAVRHAVVLAREAGPGDVRLVAYVVFQEGEDLTVSDVRRHLRKELPDYMIPSLVVTLQALPLTPNGKLDRAALPDPFAAAARPAAAHVPPAPGLEQVLAEIWRDILRVDRVGAEDNFFELGGHSLLSLRVAAAVERRLGWRMDPRMLFFQTLRQVAAAAAKGLSGTAG